MVTLSSPYSCLIDVQGQGLSTTVLKTSVHFLRFCKIVLGPKAVYFLKLGFYNDQMLLIRCNLQQLDFLNRLVIAFIQLKFQLKLHCWRSFRTKCCFGTSGNKPQISFLQISLCSAPSSYSLSGISEVCRRSPQTANVLGFKETNIFYCYIYTNVQNISLEN